MGKAKKGPKFASMKKLVAKKSIKKDGLFFSTLKFFILFSNQY